MTLLPRQGFALKNKDKRNEHPARRFVERAKEALHAAIRANARAKFTVTKTKLVKALEATERLELLLAQYKDADLVTVLIKIGEERGVKLAKVSDEAIFFANLIPNDNKEGGLSFTQEELSALIGTTKATIGKRARAYREKHPNVFSEENVEKILSGDPREAYRAMVVGLQQDILATTSMDMKYKLRKEIMNLSKDKMLEDLEAKDLIADTLHKKFTTDIPMEINREVRKFFIAQGITAEFDVREQILKVLEADKELLELAKNKQ